MPAEIIRTVLAAAGCIQPLEKIYKTLKRKWGYVTNLKDNFDKLEGEERDFLSREETVNGNLATNVGRVPTNDCTTWLDKVSQKKKKLVDLKRRHESISNKKYFCGLCPFLTLLRVGKDIVKETKAIEDLKNAAPDVLTVSPPPDQYVRRHAIPIDDYPSLNEYVRYAQELLEDDEINTICITGWPGVGKTTVMENLHDRVIGTKPFEQVFWVTLIGMDIETKIQEVLWKQLGLVLEQTSNYQNTGVTISKELENKRYVLFLDQVESEVDLRKVGICNHKGIKVVYACSYKNISKICGLWSINEHDVKIKKLPYVEAQNMFKKRVGEHILGDPDIKTCAPLLVEQCGGIPKLINMIALQLAGIQNPAIWRHTLLHLQAPNLKRNEPLQDFIRFFNLVYDKLEDTEKKCLLYWEIFPIGYQIHRDYIIEYWITEQLFAEEQLVTEDNSLGTARDSGHSILHKFVAMSIVERGTKPRHYKMFEFFHKIAQRRGSQDMVLVKGAKAKIKDDDEWSHAKKISLMSHQSSTLPEKPKCYDILTLFLQENQHLMTIPESFFTCMEKLQLLDLHGTRIKSLPQSISSLTKLKSLYLHDCKKLEELPSEIFQLQNLEIFDLSGTRIHGVLYKVEELTSLKCLRFTFEHNIQTESSSHNCVQSESSSRNYVQAEASNRNHAQPEASSRNHIQSESSSPNHVESKSSSLNHAQSKSSSPKHVQSELSSLNYAQSESSSSKHVQSESSSLNHPQSESSSPKHVQSELSSLNQAQSESSSPKHVQSESSSPNHFQSESTSRNHVQSKSSRPSHVQSKSSSHNHAQAEASSPNHVQSESSCCNHVHAELIRANHVEAKVIGSRNHVQIEPGNLNNVQGKEISSRKGKEISGRNDVQAEASSRNHVQAQPRDVILVNRLSKLTFLEELSIHVNHYSTKWNDIVDEVVNEVVKLEELTNLCFYFPKVDSLETFVGVSKSWNRVSDKEDMMRGSRFRSFHLSVGYHQANSSCSFDIFEECSAEKHLRFSAGVGVDVPNAILQVLKQARTFELIGHQNLLHLSIFGTDNLSGLEICKVAECKEMKSIIHGDRTGRVAFERLKKLYIINLPRLMHIWEGSMQHESLPMLTTLILKGCPMLKNIFSSESRIIQELPKLQHLEVQECLELVEIVETATDVQPSKFPKLKTLELQNLPKLLTLCPLSMEWPSWELIQIKMCGMLKVLPFSRQNAVKLRTIRCTRTWKAGLESPTEDVEQLFQYIV